METHILGAGQFTEFILTRVVVNKTFLGHPKKSSTIPRFSPQIQQFQKSPTNTIQVPPKFTQIGFLKNTSNPSDSFGPVVNLTKEFVGWGVCWKLGEIFVGKRGIVEDFLECPRNVLLTTTTLKSAQEKVLKNDNSHFFLPISPHAQKGPLAPAKGTFHKLRHQNFLRTENVRFRFRPRRRNWCS